MNTFLRLPALVLSLLALCVVMRSADAADAMSADDAWASLPQYEYGQDMAPLLAIDRVVIEAMADPSVRAACAARLAGLLEKPQTTLAAKKYVCFQLRQIGTPAEVPMLARLLVEKNTSEMARYALQAIAGEASLVALREGLKTLRGKELAGVVQSVAVRGDEQSVPALKKLADADDPAVAAAAVSALGNLGGEQATAFLLSRMDITSKPAARELAVALLRCAVSLEKADSKQQAVAIFERLSKPGEAVGVRRAALESLLRQKGDAMNATVVAWLTQGDDAQRRLAAGHIQDLSDKQLEELVTGRSDLDEQTRSLVLQTLAARQGSDVLPQVLELVNSSDRQIKLSGIRLLGTLGDATTIPLLVKMLDAEQDIAEAAGQALLQLPAREEVGKALLDALRDRPQTRDRAIDVLVRLKYYPAIDPLIALAASDDPAVYGPALDGLRGIADPDSSDIPRLVRLYLRTPPGKRRDEVEKTILIVCDKASADIDRAGLVLKALGDTSGIDAADYLPLLGRLGGPAVKQRVEAALAASDPAIREAALRALCNWPNAEVADQLLKIATSDDNRTHQRWALRAYIRVVSLPCDRAPSDTLAMLQKAMQLAENVDDRRLVIRRAAAVRTMASVDWIAQYLDQQELAQAACAAIVELAHHRFLRHPNLKRFDPILRRVAEISTDANIAERANRYRLGL